MATHACLQTKVHQVDSEKRLHVYKYMHPYSCSPHACALIHADTHICVKCAQTQTCPFALFCSHARKQLPIHLSLCTQTPAEAPAMQVQILCCQDKMTGEHVSTYVQRSTHRCIHTHSPVCMPQLLHMNSQQNDTQTPVWAPVWEDPAICTSCHMHGHTGLSLRGGAVGEGTRFTPKHPGLCFWTGQPPASPQAARDEGIRELRWTKQKGSQGIVPAGLTIPGAPGQE